MHCEVLQLLGHKHLILEEGVSSALVNGILAIYLVGEHLSLALVNCEVNGIALVGPHSLVNGCDVVAGCIAICLVEEAIQHSVVFVLHGQRVLYVLLVAIGDYSDLGFVLEHGHDQILTEHRSNWVFTADCVFYLTIARH